MIEECCFNYERDHCVGEGCRCACHAQPSLLRNQDDITVALSAYFRDAMRAWGVPMQPDISINNRFWINDRRDPKKRYRVTVEEVAYDRDDVM